MRTLLRARVKLSKVQEEALAVLCEPGNFFHFMDPWSHYQASYYFDHLHHRHFRVSTVDVLIQAGLARGKQVAWNKSRVYAVEQDETKKEE